MARGICQRCTDNKKPRNVFFLGLVFLYPLPLHDKDRLEKWLKNMKGYSWVNNKFSSCIVPI
uniref:THAP-type domain-containing protein n=1 Tax=Oryctolagus cuniculus TaxID=9986 RepID=A0A5F9D9B4_RABIT